MFYAYLPDSNGREPVGGDKKIIRHDLKSESYFIRYAKRHLGQTCRCYRIIGDNFYRESSHQLIYDGDKLDRELKLFERVDFAKRVATAGGSR